MFINGCAEAQLGALEHGFMKLQEFKAAEASPAVKAHYGDQPRRKFIPII